MGTYVYGLLGLMCGKTMRRPRHTYLTNHTDQRENNISNINGLAFYHLIRWSLKNATEPLASTKRLVAKAALAPDAPAGCR